MDPQQELYSEILVQLKTLGKQNGYGVYDGFLPPPKTPYPFIYLADNTLDDEINKTAAFGIVSQTIHVWHNNPYKRGTVSKMLLDIKDICRGISHTKNFGWMITAVNQRILPDTTTKQPLLHGILQIDFKFS